MRNFLGFSRVACERKVDGSSMGGECFGGEVKRLLSYGVVRWWVGGGRVILCCVVLVLMGFFHKVTQTVSENETRNWCTVT